MAFVVQICTVFTAEAHLWREIKSSQSRHPEGTSVPMTYLSSMN